MHDDAVRNCAGFVGQEGGELGSRFTHRWVQSLAFLAAGGIGICIGAKGSTVVSYALGTGVCLRASVVAGSSSRPTGVVLSTSGVSVESEKRPGGHTKAVTCLLCQGHRVYTGSLDCSVRVWDTEEFGGDVAAEAAAAAPMAADSKDTGLVALGMVKLEEPVPPFALMVLEGHSGAVTALGCCGLLLASGGADQKVLLWRSDNGTLLRQIRGFDASILSVSMLPTHFTVGCADSVMRMFDIGSTKRTAGKTVTPRWMSACTEAGAVTCMAHTSVDVVCGHRTGALSIWAAVDGTRLSLTPLHGGAVLCLQMDATKIVSCGMDGLVKVTDSCTLVAIRSIPLASPGVALQFDDKKLIVGTRKGDLVVLTWYVEPLRLCAGWGRGVRVDAVAQTVVLRVGLSR
jgi:WD40 repeat protein